MVRLRKKFHDPGKALLDLAPDGHVVAPGVAFLPLGVGKIRGDDIGPPVASFSSLGEGPAGRGATAMAVAGRRRPWAAWQVRPEVITGRGKERGRARAPTLALGSSGEAAGRAGHGRQARQAKTLAAAAMHGSGGGAWGLGGLQSLRATQRASL